MERIIIYGLVLLDLCIGLLLYYRRPRPFGRRTYEAYLQAERMPESSAAAGTGEQQIDASLQAPTRAQAADVCSGTTAAKTEAPLPK